MNRTVLFRKVVLSAAANPLIRGTVTKYGMRWGAKRFIAAETLEDTIGKVKQLNGRGFAVTLDYLGESVDSLEQAEVAAGMIVQTLNTIREHGLDSHLSVKLTQLGLFLDADFCLYLMKRIVNTAKECGTFVRIDMEDSTATERTLRIFHQLAEDYGTEIVGVVIQSYLFRSEKDMQELGETGANVRIVKGAYHEPKEVAYSIKKDVEAKFLSLARKHLLSGCYTAIATHDPGLIAAVKAIVQRYDIPRAQIEFQMLYGIAENLQEQLVKEGFRVRIYTPFGGHWYAYFSRRIAERPANLGFILKNIFRKR
jgi:proline dehydrogenase